MAIARYGRMRRITILLLVINTIGCGVGVEDGRTGTARGSESCGALVGDEPKPVTIRIRNHTLGRIDIWDDCGRPGPNGVFIDGDQMLDEWGAHSCDDVLEGNCRFGDCFGNN